MARRRGGPGRHLPALGDVTYIGLVPGPAGLDKGRGRRMQEINADPGVHRDNVSGAGATRAEIDGRTTRRRSRVNAAETHDAEDQGEPATSVEQRSAALRGRGAGVGRR